MYPLKIVFEHFGFGTEETGSMLDYFVYNLDILYKFCDLTRREIQTLELVAHGLTSKEIARKLDISP